MTDELYQAWSALCWELKALWTWWLTGLTCWGNRSIQGYCWHWVRYWSLEVAIWAFHHTLMLEKNVRDWRIRFIFRVYCETLSACCWTFTIRTWPETPNASIVDNRPICPYRAVLDTLLCNIIVIVRISTFQTIPLFQLTRLTLLITLLTCIHSDILKEAFLTELNTLLIDFLFKEKAILTT